jgi:hypothetical protein
MEKRKERNYYELREMRQSANGRRLLPRMYKVSFAPVQECFSFLIRDKALQKPKKINLIICRG